MGDVTEPSIAGNGHSVGPWALGWGSRSTSPLLLYLTAQHWRPRHTASRLAVRRHGVSYNSQHVLSGAKCALCVPQQPTLVRNFLSLTVQNELAVLELIHCFVVVLVGRL
jgi:hypothetical protein